MAVTALCRGGANARVVGSSVDATDVSDKGAMALCVSAASLKLTGTQIKLPRVFLMPEGYRGVCCGSDRSKRMQMYTKMYTNNHIGIQRIDNKRFNGVKWCWLQGSNPRPDDYKSTNRLVSPCPLVFQVVL